MRYIKGKNQVARRNASMALHSEQVCARCGQFHPRLQVHHITPLSQGGTNSITNLEKLCPECHTDEHRRHTVEE